MTSPTLYDHGPCAVCGNPAILHGPKRSPYPPICHECYVPSWRRDEGPRDTMLYRGHMDPDTGTITDFNGRE